MRHHRRRGRNSSLHQRGTARQAQRNEHIPRGIHKLAGMQGRCRRTRNLLPNTLRRMKHLNALLNQSQYANLLTLLREGRDRARYSKIDYDLTEEQITELEEVLL